MSRSLEHAAGSCRGGGRLTAAVEHLPVGRRRSWQAVRIEVVRCEGSVQLARGRTANCVHAADLTLVAPAHIHDSEPLDYAISVTPARGKLRTARIDRNGELLLEWTVEGTLLTGPAGYARPQPFACGVLAMVR